MPKRRSANHTTVSLTLLAALLLLNGCTTLSSATRDETRLRGEVPTALGRVLEVQIEGVEGADRLALMRALERELITGDLFDRVTEVPEQAEQLRAPVATLSVTLGEGSSRQLFDLWTLNDAFVARFELEIELHDDSGQSVIEGHITGVAADDVTDPEHLDPAKREDVRLAALQDAAMKMSRALRQAANARVNQAIESLTRITLAPGVGPVGLAVIGFDDDSGAQQRSGTLLAAHLTDALGRLGPELELTPVAEARRAIERASRLPERFSEVAPYELEELVLNLPKASLVVVGRMWRSGAQVSAQARLLDREGREVSSFEASAEGLGAMRIVAIKLAREIGAGL